MYTSGEIPEYWNTSTIVPIHKTGEITNMDNYRGIAIINTLMKVLCKIIQNKIDSLNTDYNIIRKEQGGFIRKEECVAQATTLIEILQRRKCLDKPT